VEEIMIEFSEVLKYIQPIITAIQTFFGTLQPAKNNDTLPQPSTAPSNSQPYVINIKGKNNTVNIITVQIMNDKPKIKKIDSTVNKSIGFMTAALNTKESFTTWLYSDDTPKGKYAAYGVYLSCTNNEKIIRFWFGGRITNDSYELAIEISCKEYQDFLSMDHAPGTLCGVKYDSKKGSYWIPVKKPDAATIQEKLKQFLEEVFSRGIK
jgi:hypothetical protein